MKGTTFIKRASVAATFILMICGAVWAEEQPAEIIIQEPEYMQEKYEFPAIEPEVSISAGYRFVDHSGAERSEEYEYLKNSVTLGGEARLFSYPHRFHIDMDIRNIKDYFGDVSYAYEDMVLFRGINRTLFHSLDNMKVHGLGSVIKDAGETYDLTFGMTNLFLRLKRHDYPFHLYFDATVVRKDGTQQLRNMLTSQAREIKWETVLFTVGANGHLGPVELDYSRTEKRFEVGGTYVFNDGQLYGLVPELRSSIDTIKLHTSYTGGIVASATLSRQDSKNRDSNAGSNYLLGAGEIVWTHSPGIAVTLKYRHKEFDADTPAYTNINTPVAVTPAVSSVSDSVILNARYRALTGLTLRAEYAYDTVRRRDEDAGDRALYDIPAVTRRSTVSLGADLRMIRTVKLKAAYIHKNIDNPALNVEPERSDEGRLSVIWTPQQRVNILLAYGTIHQERDHITFIDTDRTPNVPIDGGSRKMTRDRLLGSLSLMPLDNLSLTATYTYLHGQTRQAVYYNDLAAGNGAISAPFAKSKDTTNSYSLDLNYVPSKAATLGAGMSYTRSNGKFLPGDSNLDGGNHEIKTEESVYHVNGEYHFPGGFTAGLNYKYIELNDLTDNGFDDVEDGRAHIVMATLSKKW